MAHSGQSSSSKKDKNPRLPEHSNNSSVHPLHSGMNVQQQPFTSQNPFSVLLDLGNDGESFDHRGPQPLRSSSDDNGGPKSLRTSSNDNGIPKSLRSSSNDNGRPKSLQSSSASVKSPKRSTNKGFRNQQETASDSSSRIPPMSDQTRQWLKKYELRLACSTCFVHSEANQARNRYLRSCQHTCRGDVVICKLQSQCQPRGIEVWGRIRERQNLSFRGKFRVCKCSQCCPKGDACVYCHSEEEQDIWTAERSGQFSWSEIVSNLLTIQDIFVPSTPKQSPKVKRKTIRGSANCYSTQQQPLKGNKSHAGKTYLKSPMYNRNSDKQLIVKIMTETEGCFLYLCEKCFDSTPPIMCTKSAIGPHYSRPQEHPWEPHCSRSQEHPWEPNKVLVHMININMKEGKIRFLKIRQLPRNSLKKSARLCPDIDKQSGCIQGNSCRWAHNKVELTVWKYQIEHKVSQYKIAQFCSSINVHSSIVSKILQSLRNAASDDNQSTSNQMVAYYGSKESWFYVRPRPPSLSPEAPPVCKYGDECWNGNTCKYPHSVEEAELWVYMATHQYQSLDDVLSATKSPDSSSSSPRPLVSKEVFQILPYYCQYCNEQFPDLENLHQHLQTLDHRSNVNSDKERADDWRYRELPLNVVNGGFKQCKVVQEGGTCSLGDSSCTHAHSPKELAEWKSRYEYRLMKRKMAKEQGLYALTENDLLEMQNVGRNVMTTSPPSGVSIECSEKLSQFLEVTETKSCTWKFNITTTKKNPLKKVCLLRDDHRMHFYLPNPKDGAKLQECPGNLLVAQDADAGGRYCASIEFESSSLGSFNQLVRFDFGSMPVVVREIVVDVGPQTLQTSKTHDEILPEPALKHNCKVIKFADKFKTKKPTFTEELLEKYKAPASLSKDHGCLETLCRDNYKQVQHQVLYLEEMECNKKISRFTTAGTLKVSLQAVLQDHSTEYAQDGYMFASVNLKRALIDDTVASQIVIRDVQSVLLEFTDSNKMVHYEAAILRNQTLGDKEEEVLVIKLSRECIADQQLKDGVERNVKIQFQLNRTPFCVMHFAIDVQQNMDMVVPQGNGPQMLPPCPSSVAVSEKSNAHQNQVIAFISKHGGSEAPPMPGVGPVLMYGPFGTGKTSTLAMAVMHTLKERPGSKILICTHSNSAADLYITKYLTDDGTFRMIRIYATNRKLNSIHHRRIHNYVPKDENGNICLPDNAHIQASQVVVTTLTMAMHLVNTGLHGSFSHILIDEAGQGLEAEILIPLALATKDTCVVLTGDHKQMSPKFFCKRVRDSGLNKSLLQRLFEMKACKQMFLTINYRTCQPILDFISKTFYKQTLQAGIEHLEHPHFKPMTFCVVKGVEYHMGMSYNNAHEAHEVERQVQKLKKEWPAEWGDFQGNVAVLAPYTMQVRQIRECLRSKDLHRVTVETVDNVQGKQFRAVVISTVRTRVINKAIPDNRQDVDTEFDYRFLSDPKLVNTAFTRAQSVLCVVGDPVALCSVGRCATIWKDYLKSCEQSKSLLPLGNMVEAIQGEILSAYRKLNPKATPFQPHHQKQKQQSINLNDLQEFPPLQASSMIASEARDDDDEYSFEEDSLCSDDHDSDSEDEILRLLERQVEEDEALLEMTADEESIAKVTFLEKPVGGEVVQPQGEGKDGGHNGQGDGLESIAKVAIPKKPVDGEVVQPQGESMDGRQPGGGNEPESIAKVNIQNRDDNKEVAQPQGESMDGRQPGGGYKPESIAKVNIQNRDDNKEVVQPQGESMDGRRPGGGNEPESIAKVNIQNRDDNKVVAQSQGEYADAQQPGAGANDGPESMAKVEVQERAGGTKPGREELPEIKMMPKPQSKKQNIRMQKKDNLYMLINFKNDRSNLLGADSFDEDDAEEEQENGLEMMSQEKREEGLCCVSDDPKTFKRCLFHFETSGFIYAIPNGECSSEKIWICGKKRKGQALNMDEVVVEILENDEPWEKESVMAESNEKKIYGRVICILKRSTNPYSREIVCTMDKYSDNLLVPIDRTFPKIVAFSRADGKKKKGHRQKTGDVVQVTVFKKKRQLGSNKKRRTDFDKYAYVQRKHRQNKLFLVAYSHWHSGHRFPMGHVVGELSPGDNEDDGLYNLKLTHGVREEFNQTVHKEIERKFPSDWTIPDSEIGKRKDLRSKLIFTVDNPETQDLDDALSIDKQKDGSFRVGIHIADVSYYVNEESSALDREARERAVSFYPASSKPVHMLPSRLVDLCSLQPGKDRLAISVFVTIKQNGCILTVDTIERSVIRSQKRLTYDDAERMITNSQHEGTEEAKMVFQLGKLAKLVRKKRLGEDGCHVYSHDSQKEELQHPFASSMVEEIMLIANEAVAVRLMHADPKLTPLRSQLPPSPDKLNDWQIKHQRDIPNSLFLKSKVHVHPRGTEQTGAVKDVFMMKEKQQKLERMADNHAPSSMMQMADIVCCDQNYPQLAVAQREFFHIQEKAAYISSGDQQEGQKRRHHTLQKIYYTHFTSPIRRYIDIVAHRMLICDLQKQTAQTSGMSSVSSSDPPYSMEEMSLICHHNTVQSERAKRFQKETEALMFALKLKEVPVTIPAYVASTDGANLELIFPHLSFIPTTTYKLPLSHLKPHTKHDKTDNDDDKISLTWKLRVYDVNGVPEEVRSVARLPLKTLDTEQLVVRVNAAVRQSMLKTIKKSDLPGFLQILRKEKKHQWQRKSDKRSKRRIDKESTLPVTEVTSEMVDSKGNHATFVEIARDFKPGDVLQVTLFAALFKGMMSPRIQLVSLTPKLNFCTEHRAEPLQSFQVVASKSLGRFSDIQTYKATWLPIIEMVGVHSAVHEDETIFIRDVEIKCSQVIKEGTESRYEGVFNIPASFCAERKINFYSPHFKSDEKEESDEEETNDEPESHLHYLCIQYYFKQCLDELDSEAGNEHQSSPNFDSPGPTTAVLHAAVINVNRYKSDLTVHFVVKGSSSPFPEVLLSSTEMLSCTVEVIPKAETDRRLQGAVRMVDKASPMIRNIALGSQPVSVLCDMTSQIPNLLHIIRKVTQKPFELNENQRIAVTMAAKHSFTTIQGPPGTGKTIVGARITKLYSDLNKELHRLGICNKRCQVLYCGPSNESVNVITNYLLNCGVKLVRVYGSMIEDQQNPIPNSSVRKDPTVRDNVVPAELEAISLHYLIRQPSNSHSDKIKEFDGLFSIRDYHPSREEVKEYKKLVATAKEEELPKYDVILSTCNHSGSPVIAGKANIAQCIIDEAGMCSQPETLVPLVFNKPRQVVLIGDHKQLRPIITEITARQLGMETSLLELYEEKALMLTTQYRMHESICAFPSQEFYKSKLETADSVKQRPPEHRKLLKNLPGGEDYRAVFCHVIGREKILACKASEGNEMSRANLEEVDHAVRIAKSLLNHGVKPAKIVILSQYRLQCAEIRDALTKGRRDLNKIKVTTVITSQGREWDYVILSLVRSLPKVEIEEKPSLGWKHHNLGFIMDENQMNVALTRAKKGLIIIGNRFLLQVHDKWHDLLTMYQDNCAIIPARSFLHS